LKFENLLDQVAERLGHYASLKSAGDSSNNDHLSRQAELTKGINDAIHEIQVLPPSPQFVMTGLNQASRGL
jgi:hypothetical protein